MIQKLLIATGNQSKVEEIGERFMEHGVTVTAPDREGFTLERPESGQTYRQNALIKAREGFNKSNLPSLADDSGLEVDALNGRPGVRSDRWAGETSSATERNEKMLKKLSDVPGGKRQARFVCWMVLYDHTGERLRTQGICHGRISRQATGNSGFGYDPIFEVERLDWQTFGEVDPSTKKEISHRALALDEMIRRMKEEGLLQEVNQVNNS